MGLFLGESNLLVDLLGTDTPERAVDFFWGNQSGLFLAVDFCGTFLGNQSGETERPSGSEL